MRARFEDMPDTTPAAADIWRKRAARRGRRRAWRRPAISWARRRRCWHTRASASSSPATTSAGPIPPARRSSRCRATSSSPRRPSPCRSSTIPPTRARSASCCAPSRPSPNARIWSASMRWASASGVIKLLRAAGYDKRIWLHGAPAVAVQALPGARRRSRRRRAGVRRHPRNLQGRHRALPALGDRRPLVAALRRSGRRDVLGLDGRARPRPPARRRAAADHLRPCRLGRADRRPSKDVGAPKVWVTHGREEALVHYARSIGIDAEALHLAGREEEGA